MKRNIERNLLAWKKEHNRKSLLIRGARQVGKTYSLRSLGKSFKHYLEVNFEEDRTVKQFFSGSLDPAAICQKLSAYYGIPVISGDTLLFFDEIQACPEALSSLRFFYEKMPDLHVAAAGSLLEFAISEIPSHGVGRIRSLFMYPLSFDEFLNACGEAGLIEIKSKASGKYPLDDIFHQKLIDYLKIFYILGGMPEIVNEYSKTKDILICQTKLNDLIETLKDDFAKYKKRAPVQRLNEVYNSVALQAGSKFKFSNIESFSCHNSLKESLELIIQAGLAYKAYHTSAQGIPLGAQIKINKFKVLLNDPGIHQKLTGLNISDIIAAENFNIINKGCLAEIFVGTEILKYAPPDRKNQLFYWHKEQRGSNAEVDYLIQKNEEILPVEVKSGTKGQMQSMRIFLKSHNLNRGIRISLENFACYENITVCPLYAVSNIF
ncbi:MAG: ATP-binding protein [Candidatus Omnitrophica bacterium]|nr:ATP-binding protein [Candidatus Omnitrophota bacterium]